MQPVKIAKSVNFDCGCLSEFVLLGSQSEQYDWHVIPCNSCAKTRKPGDLEQRAERAWVNALNSTEKGLPSLAHAQLSEELRDEQSNRVTVDARSDARSSRTASATG